MEMTRGLLAATVVGTNVAVWSGDRPVADPLGWLAGLDALWQVTTDLEAERLVLAEVGL